MLPEMEPVAIAAVTIVSGAGLWKLFKMLQSWNAKASEDWELAADRLGLHSSPGSAFHPPTISGKIGLLLVAIGPDDADSRTVYTVEGLSTSLTLQSEGFFATPLSDLAGQKDHLTGDPEFDSAVRIGGSEAEAVSLLFDPEVRRLALAAVRDHDVVLTYGKLRLDSDLHAPSPHEIVRLARVVIDLAQAIENRLELPTGKRLREAVLRQDGPIARRALELLVERQPGTLGTIKACQGLLEHVRDPETRLLAARHAGPAGLEHLARLARDMRGTPATVRAAAFKEVLATMAIQESKALLEEGLRDVMREVRLVAIRAVRELRRMECTARLATLASHAGVDEEEQLAIAETMDELGGEHAERALIALLSADTAAVRLAAAQALRQHGTIAAVGPLLATAESSGVLSAVRTAAQDAVRAIQDRVPGSAAGQLALAPETPDVAGAVSLADARGALSQVPAGTKRRDP